MKRMLDVWDVCWDGDPIISEPCSGTFTIAFEEEEGKNMDDSGNVQDPTIACRNDGDVSADLGGNRSHKDALGRRVQSLFDAARAKEQEGRRIVFTAEAALAKAKVEQERLQNEANECRLLGTEINTEMNQPYPLPLDTH